MVNGRKVFSHVALQDVRIPAAAFCGHRQCAMRSFAFPAGKGLVREAPLEYRLQHTRKGVVCHAVPERSGGNNPRLIESRII
jgi:hypothetical protein